MKIVVKINKATGQAVTSVDGVVGEKCLDLTRVIRQNSEAAAPLKRSDEFDQNILVVGSVGSGSF